MDNTFLDPGIIKNPLSLYKTGYARNRFIGILKTVITDFYDYFKYHITKHDKFLFDIPQVILCKKKKNIIDSLIDQWIDDYYYYY